MESNFINRIPNRDHRLASPQAFRPSLVYFKLAASASLVSQPNQFVIKSGALIDRELLQDLGCLPHNLCLKHLHQWSLGTNGTGSGIGTGIVEWTLLFLKARMAAFDEMADAGRFELGKARFMAGDPKVRRAD
jgi:hypothetical protein